MSAIVWMPLIALAASWVVTRALRSVYLEVRRRQIAEMVAARKARQGGRS